MWIFLRVLYLYKKKVVLIVDLEWGVWWVKVLIFLWFYDIGCDIEIFVVNGWEVWILVGFGNYFLSWCVDESAMPGFTKYQGFNSF